MEIINYNHNDKLHNKTAALEILPFLFSLINVSSILDIGCGNGSWLQAARELGVLDVYGVDGIEVDEASLKISRSNFLQHDFRKPLELNRKFDLVMSLEVAEHLPEESADNFIDIITNHGDVILFSAAIPNQGGQYHLNEQWPEYWADKFKKKGFLVYDVIRPEFWNNKDIFSWYKQNTILYAKEGVLKAKELQPVDAVLSLIHPDIYKKKTYQPKYLKEKKEILSLLKDTSKVYIKRLIGK